MDTSAQFFAFFLFNTQDKGRRARSSGNLTVSILRGGLSFLLTSHSTSPPHGTVWRPLSSTLSSPLITLPTQLPILVPVKCDPICTLKKSANGENFSSVYWFCLILRPFAHFTPAELLVVQFAIRVLLYSGYKSIYTFFSNISNIQELIFHFFALRHKFGNLRMLMILRALLGPHPIGRENREDVAFATKASTQVSKTECGA